LNPHVNVLTEELIDIQTPVYQGVILRGYTVNRLTYLKKEDRESIDAVINTMLDERKRDPEPEKKVIGESS
jgi:hypothetical protein